MAILKIKDENGNIIEIPAIKGADGITPVRGIDYWTEEDKEEMKAYINEIILGGAW